MKLLECPFCNTGEAKLIKISASGMYIVKCCNNLCEAGPSTIPRSNPVRAMEAWNNRKEKE